MSRRLATRSRPRAEISRKKPRARKPHATHQTRCYDPTNDPTYDLVVALLDSDAVRIRPEPGPLLPPPALSTTAVASYLSPPSCPKPRSARRCPPSAVPAEDEEPRRQPFSTPEPDPGRWADRRKGNLVEVVDPAHGGPLEHGDSVSDQPPHDPPKAARASAIDGATTCLC